MASMPDPMGTIRVEHVTATNAQVALQAAAAVYSGGRGYTSAQVFAFADECLKWLEARDSQAWDKPASPLLKAAADRIR